MPNHKHYTYHTIWSAQDQEYIAQCAEFPSLSYLADSPVEAVDALMNIVKDVVEDMRGNGEVVPVSLNPHA